MIFVTGDCHASFSKFSTQNFPEQKQLCKEDVVIILGDFGGVWEQQETKEEKWWLDWLNEKPYTTLFIDGNHENFDRLKKYPLKKRYGAYVHEIRPSVLHLMRGNIYTIEGKTFLAFGGAPSHDIKDGILDPSKPYFKEQKRYLEKSGKWMYRILGESWWPEELPNKKEYDRCLKNLDKVGWKVDYILTHDCPKGIAEVINRNYGTAEINDFLDKIDKKCEFKHWYFGHYHFDWPIGQAHTCLYEEIIQLEEKII